LYALYHIPTLAPRRLGRNEFGDNGIQAIAEGIHGNSIITSLE